MVDWPKSRGIETGCLGTVAGFAIMAGVFGAVIFGPYYAFSCLARKNPDKIGHVDSIRLKGIIAEESLSLTPPDTENFYSFSLRTRNEEDFRVRLYGDDETLINADKMANVGNNILWFVDRTKYESYKAGNIDYFTLDIHNSLSTTSYNETKRIDLGDLTTRLQQD